MGRIIKVIKKQTGHLSYPDEKASVDFRAFYAVAKIHVGRVKDPTVKDVMLEVLDDLRKSLLNTQRV